jgi:hypothetical protein
MRIRAWDGAVAHLATLPEQTHYKRFCALEKPTAEKTAEGDKA